MIDQQPTVVSLTDAAVVKLQELTKEETNPQIGLRVYVYSGGCSGFRYGMMLEDAPTPEDRVLEASGIKVYVDGQSVDLLKGAQIDYVDTLMGAGLHGQQPERRGGLRLRFELPDGRRLRRAKGLRSLTFGSGGGRRTSAHTRDQQKPPAPGGFFMFVGTRLEPRAG